MFKTIAKLYPYRYHVAGVGAILSALSYCANQYFRKTHPLVKHAQEIISQNDKLKAELGSFPSMSFLIHRLENPHDNEVGFTYKITGNKTPAEVTVIGDYRTHAELSALNEKKKTLLKEIQEGEDPVQTLLRHKDSVPVNIGRFYVTTKDPRKERISVRPIDPKEHVWRVKELIVETPRVNHKVIAEDEAKDIAISEYTLRTYGDSSAKMKFNAYQLKDKAMAQEAVKGGQIESSSIFRSWILKNAIGALVLSTAFSLLRRKAVASGPAFYMALDKLRESTSVRSFLGRQISALWVRGRYMPYVGRAKFEVQVYGEKGEGMLAVTATKNLLAKKSNREWRIKRLTLVHNGQIINI